MSPLPIVLWCCLGLAPVAIDEQPESTPGIQRADLVLRMHPSQMPPRGSFELEVRSITSAWSESDVSWNTAPEISHKRVDSVRVKADVSDVEFDVTKAAKQWVAHPDDNHGLLIKIRKPRTGAKEWVYFDSRESGTPPILRVRYDNGESRQFLTVADAPIISYLGDRSYGGIRQLSVSFGDTNRVVLAFDLTAEQAGPVSVRRMPAEIGLRFDWIDFLPTVEAALERAKETRRAVMLFVNPWDSRDFEWGYEGAEAVGSIQAFDPASLARDPGYTKERGMLTVLLGNPALSGLVRENFVPVRMRLHAWHFFAEGRGPFVDPFPRVGTKAEDVRPPAILWVSPEGELLHKIDRMSVFNPYLVYRTCRAILDRHPDLHPQGDPSKRGIDRARHLASRGRFAEARRANRPRDRSLEAWMLALEGKLDEAEAMMRSLPKSDEYRAAGLGEILIRKGEYEKARVILRVAAAHRDGPFEPTRQEQNLFYLGLAEHRLGNIEEAKRRWSDMRGRDGGMLVDARARLYLDPGSPPPREWESLDRMDVDPLIETTEQGGRATPLVDAVSYLLSQQRPDGYWGLPADPMRMAIQDDPRSLSLARTALALDALTFVRDHLSESKKERDLLTRIDGAIDRGTDVLSKRTATGVRGVWNQTYTLHRELSAYRDAESQDRKAAKARIENLMGQILVSEHDGGWSYTGAARLHTFNTAPILLLLLEARDLGFRVSPGVIERSVAFLERNRVKKDSLFHYGTTMEHMMPVGKMETSSCLRSPLCELALYRARGDGKTEAITRSLEIFFEHLAGARSSARIFESYVDPTTMQDSYRYFFGVYYAARAISKLGEKERRAAADRLRERVLSHQEIDGSFVDSLNTGKVSSTALALLALEALVEQSDPKR